MGAGFDKPANARHFTLRFPRVQKIHLDRTVKETVSFVELQKMAQAADTEPQADEEVTDIDRPEISLSPSLASPTLSKRSTSTEPSQSSVNTATASPALTQDEWMRAEDLVMIKERESTTAENKEQRTETICNKDPIGLHRQTRLDDSRASQGISQHSDNSMLQASMAESQPAQTRVRRTSQEIPDSQPEHPLELSSSVIATPKRARTQSTSYTSRPEKRAKWVNLVSQDLADDTDPSITSWTRGRKRATKFGPASICSSAEPNRGQHRQGSESACASQVALPHPHPRASHFRINFLDFLSQLRMPVFACDSSRGKLFSLYQDQFDVLRELAVSFTFSANLFIDFVLATSSGVDAASNERSHWHIALARLDSYQSFSNEVLALVAMIDKQYAVAARDFHLLFADASLFQPYPENDDRSWQGAIQAYLRCRAGKIVQLTYGVNFRADFLQGVR